MKLVTFERLLLVGGMALIGASRYALRARVPDDYDAVGFVLALDRFDLASLQPHFPGYPVYVALGRAAHVVVRSPVDAAALVSAVAAATTAGGLWLALRRLRGDEAAWIGFGLYAAAALPWLLGGAALSDGTATAFAVLAFAALAEEKAFVAGVLASLMLGTRASYFPLAASWLAALVVWRRALLRRGLAGVAIGALLWIVPFVAVVGARPLWALGIAHLRGHFVDWGGSIATRPDPALRLFSFARDLLYDGVAPRVWAAAALVAILLLAWRLRRPAVGHVGAALLIGAPYALWALLGQNVVEQPRHVLPLVVLLIAGAALILDGLPSLAVAAMAVMATVSLPLALAHARTLPAAAQLAAYVTARYGDDRRDVALFGGRSIRTVRFARPSLVTKERTWLTEVDVELERLPVLPLHALVTSELEVDPRRAHRLQAGPTFCRDERLDRRQPCLQLLEYKIFEGRTP